MAKARDAGGMVSKELREGRMAACNTCDSKTGGFPARCGLASCKCPIASLALFTRSTCPRGKWP